MRNIVKHQIINSLLRTVKDYLALAKAKSLFRLYKEKHLLRSKSKCTDYNI